MRISDWSSDVCSSDLLATDAKVVVLRNGWFSYRWTQILEAGKIPAESFVLKARPMEPESGERGRQAPFQPVPVEEAVALIPAECPAVVFPTPVETPPGLTLPAGLFPHHRNAHTPQGRPPP